RDQLGKKLADAADVDFDSEMPELDPAKALVGKPTRDRKTGRGTNTVEINRQRFRFTDHAELSPEEWEAQREQRPVRSPRDRVAPRSGPPRGGARDDRPAGPPRHIHFDEDGRAPEEYQGKAPARARGDRDGGPNRSFGKPRFEGAGKPRRDAEGADARPARGPRPPRREGD